MFYSFRDIRGGLEPFVINAFYSPTEPSCLFVQNLLSVNGKLEKISFL